MGVLRGLRVFHESFKAKEVSSMGCFMIFKGVSRLFQGSFNKTFKVLKKVSCCMAPIAASRAEGGLVKVGFSKVRFIKLVRFDSLS